LFSPVISVPACSLPAVKGIDTLSGDGVLCLFIAFFRVKVDSPDHLTVGFPYAAPIKE
jgi:hypothetical protein